MIELAEASKPLQVLAFDPFATLALIGLTTVLDGAAAGVPPEHEARLALTVVTVFFTPGVPAELRGGLKVMLPPILQLTVPVPLEVLATAVPPPSNTTLASGSVAAAKTSKPFFIRMFLPSVCWIYGPSTTQSHRKFAEKPMKTC